MGSVIQKIITHFVQCETYTLQKKPMMVSNLQHYEKLNNFHHIIKSQGKLTGYRF